MKKMTRAISILLCLIMLAGCIPFTSVAEGETSPFTDVPVDSWCYKFVSWAYEKGYIAGRGNGIFDPSTPITRAEYVGILSCIAGIDKNDYTGEAFTDVVPGRDWYAPAVKWATENEIIAGVGNGEFMPELKITRQELCVMTIKYIEKVEKLYTPIYKEYDEFEDDGDISKYARESVKLMRQCDMIAGTVDGTFEPLGSATRAEASVILFRMCEMIEKLTTPKDRVITLYFDTRINSLSSAPNEDMKNADIILCTVGELRQDGSIQNYNEYTLANQVRGFKAKFPDAKVLMTMYGAFENSTYNEDACARFADSIMNIMNKTGLDGVDIDWEYPNEITVQYHTNLIMALRNRFDKESESTGKHYYVTISSAFGEWALTKSELEKIHIYLDYINLMTYDIKSDKNITFHHTAPCDTSVNKWYTYASLEANLKLLLSKHIPQEKILGGVGFNARRWRFVEDPENNGGLGVATPEGGGYYTADLASIERLAEVGLYEEYFDEEAQASYLYGKAGKEFISFESRRSCAAKCDLVRKYNIGGLMIFTYHLCPNCGVLTEIRDNLDGKPTK
ncbi:MAG: S-layer homology domain-containing protein [Clostridia bacterium]|nr:S-layer homology domain-containing protein [Clostridia bacterium]